MMAAGAALASTGTAYADQDSYLAYLSQHGIFTFKNPQGLIASGQSICADLRSGASADGAKPRLGPALRGGGQDRHRVFENRPGVCPAHAGRVVRRDP